MTDALAIIVILTFVVALLHYIYEGILLPSIRLHYRNKLFALRDELRNIYIEEKDNIDHETFNLVHDSLSNFINRLHTLTLSLRVKFSDEYTNNPNFQKQIEKRQKQIENCQHTEIKRIVREANEILEWTFIANAGAWFLYLVPIIVCVHSIRKISEFAKELLVIPSYEANKLMPDNTTKYAG